MSATQHTAISHGHLLDSADVPQVRKALSVLTAGNKPLAGFTASHRCVSEGAYLDPRRETGEVVLSDITPHDVPAREPIDHEVTMRDYARLFHHAGWDLEEYTERDARSIDRLVRLILKPCVD